MKENNFTPKVNKSKYIVKMNFEERRQKSIDLKKKYRGEVHKYEFKKNKNEEEEIVLHPGELVRYKNKNDENENNNNNTQKMNKTMNDDFYDIKENELIKSSINSENNFNENNNNINGGDNKIDETNNMETIEKNKMIMMDKIMGEHKIGFKSNKNLGNVLKISEDKKLNEKNENENKDKDKNGDVKNGNEDEDEMPVDRYSFQNCEFHSKALKNLLNNNATQNKTE